MDWDRAFRRADGLEVNPVADGYIVYQPARDRIHYLNHISVVILELCTGSIKANEIPLFLRDAYNLGESPTTEVEQCLAKLLEEEIVQ
jgi:HrpA-like RNA helicase